MQIVKGKQQAPIRAVAYGPEGIGKSTFASKWPAPLFVDVENGTNQLEVDRVQPTSWAAVEQAVGELTSNANGYRTIVFDTADRLETMLSAKVCAEKNVGSIEDFGYGKGFVFLEEALKRFLDQVTRMQTATGCHVLFLGHAQMRKQELPNEQGAFDRWELKLSKKNCPALKEWADLVLFQNYKTIVVDNDGKKKAQGGKRVMYTTHHPCWDAKNRFGLPDECPLDFEPIAEIVKTPGTATTPPAAAKEECPADLKPVEKSAESTPEDPEKNTLLKQLAELMTNSKTSKEDLGAELARKGVVPADMNPRDYNVATLKRVVAGWTAITHNIALHKGEQNNG